jgi:putative transposase
MLTVLDQWSRESVIVELRFSYSGQAVAELLEKWVAVNNSPVSIIVDHGTEFTSKALEAWVWERGVKLDFIHPGNPTENGYIESFNARLRDECLNVNQFLSLANAKQKIDNWRQDYNRHRPRGSLGRLTPVQYVARYDKQAISGATNF